MPNSLLNPMFDSLLESSHRDDSNKLSNIGFSEQTMQGVSTELILHILSGFLFYGSVNQLPHIISPI